MISFTTRTFVGLLGKLSSKFMLSNSIDDLLLNALSFIIILSKGSFLSSLIYSYAKNESIISSSSKCLYLNYSAKEEINDDQLDNDDKFRAFPDGFKPLQYQKDAVIQAKRMLEKHNGIFISDVVGLGKTYICALLAQELPGRKLILCPPVL